MFDTTDLFSRDWQSICFVNVLTEDDDSNSVGMSWLWIGCSGLLITKFDTFRVCRSFSDLFETSPRDGTLLSVIKCPKFLFWICRCSSLVVSLAVNVLKEGPKFSARHLLKTWSWFWCPLFNDFSPSLSSSLSENPKAMESSLSKPKDWDAIFPPFKIRVKKVLLLHFNFWKQNYCIIILLIPRVNSITVIQ